MSTQRRGTDRYYETALQILDEEGYGGLKLATVCSRLSVTTGAFYHSFRSWGAFTRGLLDYWHTERTTRLIALMAAEADPFARLQMLLETSTALPHRAEAAIRVWADIDPDAARVVRKVDAERLAVVRATFAAILPDSETESFSRAALYLVIGYQFAGELQSTEALARSLNLLIERASIASMSTRSS